MNLMVIRPRDISICSRDGLCRTLSRQSTDDIAASVEALRPEGIVFLGVRNPNPIESLCQLRARGWDKTARVAIIRSEDELRISPIECPPGEVFRHFASLLQNEECVSPQPVRNFYVDLRARELSMAGRCLIFSPMEFRLLVFFLRYPGVVFSRQELLQHTARSDVSVQPQIIDVMIRRIRMKVELYFQSPHFVRTARELGYKFAENGDIFFDKITGHRFVSWPPL